MTLDAQALEAALEAFDLQALNSVNLGESGNAWHPDLDLRECLRVALAAYQSAQPKPPEKDEWCDKELSAMIRNALNGWALAKREKERADAAEAALSTIRKETVEACAKRMDAHGIGSCERGGVDPSTGTFECRRLDMGECNCAAFDEVAEELRALSTSDKPGQESEL